MRLAAKREALLKPLQHVVGVVERRQTLPILSNVLIAAEDNIVNLTATDLEVELSATTSLLVDEAGAITLPARKLLDILRALPEDATVDLSTEAERALLRCGRSRFNLATLPAANFQTLEELPFEGQLRLPQGQLKKLIERTHFAMAQQDVRYYLNGLLLEVSGNALRAVATDGHRLAFCETQTETEPATLDRQVIVPRKGIQELLRLLGDGDDELMLNIGANHVQAILDDIRFTSKLVDGKFPDYQRVIPRQGDRLIQVDRVLLRDALARAAILSNDKFRGIRLQAERRLLRIQAHNPEQEEAEEEMEVDYDGGSLEIGFNVTYLLDALNALPCESVQLSFVDASSSCLIQESDGSGTSKYVVMPMRL
ncbi:MAG: DNA polymerase III subunit beta [Gammaproteobacteria bacterium]|nr:DNA polymerase III subunit beta [Gammaproteobacteria bacterium]MCP5424428.1 DNA polymerase III subunit beta [Gammaproteobacteria bacterium]MCP5458422.1 DNA polymerase III subunit beta [Gammaproteobacteria bacterium]